MHFLTKDLMTEIVTYYVNGEKNITKFNFDNPVAVDIRDRLIKTNTQYDRRKQTDEELIAKYSELELTGIKKERERKAINAVKRNIKKAVNSGEWNYFVTFTSDREGINQNPFTLLYLSKRYLKKQGVDGILVLEPFENKARGWHIHGLTNKPVNFSNWLRNYGANADNFEDEEEFDEFFFKGNAYLNKHNLYCEVIKTTAKKCCAYTLKKIKQSYPMLKAYATNFGVERIKMFECSVPTIPTGNCIKNANGLFTQTLYKNAIFNYAKKANRFKFEYRKYIKNLTEEEFCLSDIEYHFTERIYKNIELLLPLYNKYLEGHKYNKKWLFFTEDERKLYKFLQADFVFIAKDCIELANKFNINANNLFFDAYGCAFGELDSFLENKNKAQKGRYKTIDDFTGEKVTRFYDKKEVPYFENFVYQDTVFFVEKFFNSALEIIKNKEEAEEFKHKNNRKTEINTDEIKSIFKFINTFNFVAIRYNYKESFGHILNNIKKYDEVVLNFYIIIFIIKMCIP